jgi:hypothetical protein
MIFENLTLHEGAVTAMARGHADEVVKAFREVSAILFSGQGAWRITLVVGQCYPEMTLDSDMRWELRAERKVDHMLHAPQQVINTRPTRAPIIP